jgi:hypothetical protein
MWLPDPEYLRTKTPEYQEASSKHGITHLNEGSKSNKCYVLRVRAPVPETIGPLVGGDIYRVNVP